MTKEHYVDSDFDSSGYGLIDLGPVSTAASERWLFVWVLLQALMDAGMIAPVGSGARRRNTDTPESVAARNWLLHNKADFVLVCELAGVQPFIIRSEVKRFFQAQRPARIA